ncbi:NAD(P)/FAD-dependent oxidoreductase [Pseudoxanthomonas indica]|uniref:Protein CbrA n=1 Tax=Pseudoxanthomonas indica TaxID=428993 RepID=A0A1T5IQJ4_9GAMM|nr:NAD(P)/FAD-dependent oxidoreductase [Pseudoxanthomonas indica]GGD53671.1 bacteriochlorophyll synthase [Pseudoxanthomonas indica]SKC41385.1 Dehydrogenase (flavoprotein) [Pseudoxanthomonas indica]
MESRYDLIVVGASFAGVACALEAAAAGLSVCVLERKHDPGERLHTTGILVPQALAHPLLADVPHSLLRAVPQISLYAPDLRRLQLHCNGHAFHTTDTPALMRWLAGKLPAAGVELRLGTSFREAHRDAEGWHLPGIGRCRDLVGADGARSRVAERCGLSRNTEFLHGVEFEFDDARLADADALHCFVSRRFARGYIGWVAQTPTGVQAGLAHRAHAGAPRLPDIRAFLRHVAPVMGTLPMRADSVRAGLIPCGGAVKGLSRNRAHLLGDAAGVVSPVTAGGIHSALRHGSALGRWLGASDRDPGLDARHARRFAQQAVSRFTSKRVLRWGLDHLQSDAVFNLALKTPALRRFAEQLYFHRRGDRGAGAALRQSAPQAPAAGSATMRD